MYNNEQEGIERKKGKRLSLENETQRRFFDSSISHLKKKFDSISFQFIVLNSIRPSSDDIASCCGRVCFHSLSLSLSLYLSPAVLLHDEFYNF
jgi:hypothetical protein